MINHFYVTILVASNAVLYSRMHYWHRMRPWGERKMSSLKWGGGGVYVCNVTQFFFICRKSKCISRSSLAWKKWQSQKNRWILSSMFLIIVWFCCDLHNFWFNFEGFLWLFLIFQLVPVSRPLRPPGPASKREKEFKCRSLATASVNPKHLNVFLSNAAGQSLARGEQDPGSDGFPGKWRCQNPQDPGKELKLAPGTWWVKNEGSEPSCQKLLS